MTKTVMVGLAGGFPLVNADSNLRIEPGPATEVELTTWVMTQLAAGSLVKFDPDAGAAADAEAKALADADAEAEAKALADADAEAAAASTSKAKR